MRLIDADALYMDIIHRFDYCDDFLEMLESAPSAQPEIIRCKECKHSSPNGVYGCRLERYNFNDESVRMYGEDYCSDGERRTDEN